MNKLVLSTLLILSLAACTGAKDSVIVEIRSTGVFSSGDRIDDFQLFLNEIEGREFRSLVFLVNADTPTETLKEVMSISKPLKFKSVSLSSL